MFWCEYHNEKCLATGRYCIAPNTDPPNVFRMRKIIIYYASYVFRVIEFDTEPENGTLVNLEDIIC